MDVNYVSAMAGLAGAAIGGMTSFGTTWITQRAQLREEGFTAARKKREALYVEFTKEASRLLAERDELTDLAKLYAIVAHIWMISSPEIISAAERVIDAIIDAYQGPNRTLGEIRSFAAQGGFDSLRDFGRVTRQELSAYRTPLLQRSFHG